jgi:tetratricopeptide (TPR) repeat protein
MAEITIEDSARKVKESFNKGFAALERGNLDYAVSLLIECVKAEPRLTQARKYLRIAEMRRAKRQDPSSLSRAMVLLRNLPTQIKVQTWINRGRALEAAAECEELLKDDPHSLIYINLFVAAAIKADLSESAAVTLDAARDLYPDDDRLIQRLGEIYQSIERHEEARKCFERVCELRPSDPAAVRALKNSMALHSIRADGWSSAAQKGGSFHDILKDSKGTVLMEQDSKSVKSEQDVQNLVAEMLQKIAAEPGNTNYYRNLARLYAQGRLFDDALATLRRALEVNPGDPELEATLSAMQVQKFDGEIADLRAAGDNESVATKEAEKEEFVFADLGERVKRYPNDHKLRYEWGLLILKRGMVNEAIQQFQFSQRNPRFKVLSLYNLGMCFEMKDQFDLAAEQFQRALEDLQVMDDTKKMICYELGSALEKLGDQGKALECFKQIYQVDIGFRDVAQKIEQTYTRK